MLLMRSGRCRHHRALAACRIRDCNIFAGPPLRGPAPASGKEGPLGPKPIDPRLAPMLRDTNIHKVGANASKFCRLTATAINPRAVEQQPCIWWSEIHVRIIPSNVLSTSDLIIDAIYEGGRQGNAADDPISKILQGVGNQGGFRAAGRGPDKKYVVLYTSGEDKDWPDTLDLSTGQFIYFGDNKRPGHQLHETPRKGNEILRRVFELLHASPPMRASVPPFFIFKRYPTPASSRSVQFKGLAVPGFSGLPSTADLVAVWKTTEGNVFRTIAPFSPCWMLR